MLIKRKRGWELPERMATPPEIALNRRQVLAAGGVAAAAGVLASGPAHALFGFGAPKVYGPKPDDPSTSLYPVTRNTRYTVKRDITSKDDNFVYNNYYEFRLGSAGDCGEASQALPIRPWSIAVDGMVDKPFTIDIDTLLSKMKLEERVYRHRCVEAWSMVVPWSGFPLADLVAMAKPTSDAKYLRFETFMNPKVAPGQARGIGYPWPYVEGLTMAEATNELAFMVTGAYGAPLPNEMGSPIRVHLPWKYGFKSIKAIVKVTFTDKRPVGLWQAIAGNEYGFWANVNPDVPHPRWSQASEDVLGTNERIPTLLFNGYGEFVADLYKGLQNEPLYM
jgi:methionine sulfoxide reductase catalytic subunit